MTANWGERHAFDETIRVGDAGGALRFLGRLLLFRGSCAARLSAVCHRLFAGRFRGNHINKRGVPWPPAPAVFTRGLGCLVDHGRPE